MTPLTKEDKKRLTIKYNLYFNNFKMHKVNFQNMLDLNMHLNGEGYIQNRTKAAYLIGRGKICDVLDLNLVLSSLNLATNFLYYSLLRGSKITIIEKKKKENFDSTLYYLKEIILSKLKKKKNNHVYFNNYERGLFTNYEYLKRTKARGLKKKTYGKKIKCLKSLPDIVLVNDMKNNLEWHYILNELESLKIPAIITKPLSSKYRVNNFYYIPTANNKIDTRIFY
jgi:ribosomal protein S2